MPAHEPAVSVLVPTHEHGELIGFPLRSLQRQTLGDFEVLVVGDGMTEAGRGCVQRFAAEDARFRLFDFPKGPRHGEVHRDTVLRHHARGRFVCYLADDDLLLPGALAELAAALEHADFAHLLPVYVNELGQLGVASGHLGIDAVVHRMLAPGNYNFIALTGAGHTMACYRSLPFGWRTTPAGTPTDLHMWRQVLGQPGCRRRSLSRPLALHFPSPGRRRWTASARAEELAAWERIAAADDGEQRIAALALDHLALVQTWRDARIDELVRTMAP